MILLAKLETRIASPNLQHNINDLTRISSSNLTWIHLFLFGFTFDWLPLQEKSVIKYLFLPLTFIIWPFNCFISEGVWVLQHSGPAILLRFYRSVCDVIMNFDTETWYFISFKVWLELLILRPIWNIIHQLL